MKTLKINNLLLTGIFTLLIASCDNDEDPTSVITSFEKYPVTTDFTAVTTDEGDEETITFKVALDPEKQVNDLVLEIGVGASSTAEEGIDFEIAEHEIEVPAFAGQDSVEIEVHILQDGVADEENETIYLTFNSVDPSGIDQPEMLVATIIDSDVPPSLEITLSWDSEVLYNGKSINLCDSLDMDFYLYDANGDEVTGFQGASAACPETLTATGDLPDGIYEIWVNLWNRAAFPEQGQTCTDEFGQSYTCLAPFAVPLKITFSRDGATETISYPVLTNTASDLWFEVDGEETNAYIELYVGSVEFANGMFTIIDRNDEEVGTVRRAKKVRKRTW